MGEEEAVEGRRPSATSQRKSDLQVTILRGTAFVALVMPLAIVTSYYLLGWQVAVLLFPVPLVVAGYRAIRTRDRDDGQKGASFWGALTSLTIMIGLVVLPVAAVVGDRVELMRAWAYLTVIPFGLLMASGPGLKRNLVAIPVRWVRLGNLVLMSMLVLLFVSGSELIWLAGSMGAWIWYHAFSIPIFLALLVALQSLAAAIFGRPATAPGEDGVPPPRADGDVSEPTASVILHRASRPSVVYRQVSLSQVQAIAAGIGVEQIAEADADQKKPPRPHVLVHLEDSSTIVLYRDGEETVGIRWFYFRAPGKSLSRVKSSAEQVPFATLPNIVARGWDAAWGDVGLLVAPHAKEADRPSRRTAEGVEPG